MSDILSVSSIQLVTIEGIPGQWQAVFLANAIHTIGDWILHCLAQLHQQYLDGVIQNIDATPGAISMAVSLHYLSHRRIPIESAITLYGMLCRHVADGGAQ